MDDLVTNGLKVIIIAGPNKAGTQLLKMSFVGVLSLGWKILHVTIRRQSMLGRSKTTRVSYPNCWIGVKRHERTKSD